MIGKGCGIIYVGFLMPANIHVEYTSPQHSLRLMITIMKFVSLTFKTGNVSLQLAQNMLTKVRAGNVSSDRKVRKFKAL